MSLPTSLNQPMVAHIAGGAQQQQEPRPFDLYLAQLKKLAAEGARIPPEDKAGRCRFAQQAVACSKLFLDGERKGKYRIPERMRWVVVKAARVAPLIPAAVQILKGGGGGSHAYALACQLIPQANWRILTGAMVYASTFLNQYRFEMILKGGMVLYKGVLEWTSKVQFPYPFFDADTIPKPIFRQ